MINIISTFYISNYKSPRDIERTKELVDVLNNNIQSPFIEKIHLFVDNDESLKHLHDVTKSNKIVVIEVGKKPIYSDFFNYILNNLKNNICMITNSDIYISETDENLIHRLKTEKNVYALTRYEHDMTDRLIKNYCGSHDCYIFNSKFLDNCIITDHTKYPQNLPGIESHIIKNFCDHGFQVYNPCHQIKIVHLHKTNLRSYKGTDWIGLHNCGDWDYHKKSSWWVPPIEL